MAPNSAGPLPDFSESTAETIARRAQRTMEELLSETKKTTSDDGEAEEGKDPAALFTRDEISTTVRIAQGGFCDIWAIQGIQPTSEYKSRPLTKSEEDCRIALAEEKDSSAEDENKNPEQTPEKISKSKEGLYSSPARPLATKYVLKHVSKEHTNNLGMFLAAAIDLGREAHILQSIQHSNILKLRGTSIEGVQSYKTGFYDSYFLVFDRLVETLDDRIDTWAKSSKTFVRVRSERSDRKRQVLAERLTICSDIGNALEYLHGRNIMHRDLKPTNLGFDVHGRIQLFDFGIAEQLPQNGQDNYVVTHDLEGGIGSYRYMAPEIAKSQPYNLKADVFSFAVICYYVLSLTRPHQNIDDDMLREKLFKGNGKKLKSSHMSPCSKSLCERLEDGWSWDMEVRPTMSETNKFLKEEHENVLANKAPLASNKNTDGDTDNKKGIGRQRSIPRANSRLTRTNSRKPKKLMRSFFHR